MPDVVQSKDKSRAKAIAEANRRERRDALENIFNKYLEIAAKVSEASVLLGQAVEKIVALDKEIRQQDMSGDLRLAHRLRVKVILGVVFPARQHLDRLVSRMKACASERDDTLADSDKRAQPVFE